MEKDPSDLSFARVALEMKFVSPAQVEEAFESQSKMALLGIYPKSLAEILTDMGVLSQYLVKSIYKTQGKHEGFPLIPGYEFEAKIGHGGMGTVYRARQVSLDRTVAIKILDPKLARDQTFVNRFVREARSVAQLGHENIIVGIDVGKTPKGAYFFVMEYVEGETVYEILSREHNIGEKRALEITLQIARALKHADDHKLVHRDVKPDNIMITRDSVAKLCDLGLAISMRSNLRLTQAGSTHGTPHYMSPEQARGREDIDIRSDIYSLGATLYHMLVGQVPFDGESAAIILLKHISEDLPSPRVRRPEISEAVCHILERMMAKRREDRYQNPSELMGDLEAVIGGGAPVSRRLTPGVSSIMRIPAESDDPSKLPEGFRDEPTEPMARKDLTGKGFMPLLAAVSAGAFVLVLAAGVAAGIMASSTKQGGEGSQAGRSRSPGGQSAQGGLSPVTEEEKWAKEHFTYAVAFVDDNPKDFKGALERFVAILRNYPGTLHAFRAEREILRIMDAVSAEADKAHLAAERDSAALLSGGRHVEALNVVAAALGRFAFLGEIDPVVAEKAPALRKMKDLASGTVARVEADGRERLSRAAAAAQSGDWASAIAHLDLAARMGLESVAAEAAAARSRIDERIASDSRFREEEKKRAEMRRYLAFLAETADELAARKYERASKSCAIARAEEQLSGFAARVDRIARAVTDAAGVYREARGRVFDLASAGARVVFTMKDGNEISGHPGPPGQDDTIPLYFSPDQRDRKQVIHLFDLAPEEVLELAGLYAGRPLTGPERILRGIFLLAEGRFDPALNEFTRAAERGESVESLVEAVLDFRSSRAEFEAARAMSEAQAAEAKGDVDAAWALLSRLRTEFAETLHHRSNSIAIRDASERVSKALAQRSDVQSLLRGRVEKTADGRHAISYDFSSLSQFEDWVTNRLDPAQEGWTARQGGGVLARGRDSWQWSPRFAGGIDVDLEIIPLGDARSIEFLRIEYAEKTYLFSLGLSGGVHQVFRIDTGGGGQEVWNPLASKLSTLSRNDKPVKVSVRLSQGSVSFKPGDDAELTFTEQTTGTGKLTLWSPQVPSAFTAVRVECHLDPGWVLGDNRPAFRK